jgi:uncharacterized membrane protein
VNWAWLAAHPVHPLLVTVPIGAFTSSLIFDILTHTRENGLPYLVDGAWWLIEVGLYGGVIAAVFGLLDIRTIPRGTPARTTARRHMVLNVAALVLFAIGFGWRARDHLAHDKTPWDQLALSAVGMALLAAAVWHGSRLTYHHGVRVHDHR